MLLVLILACAVKTRDTTYTDPDAYGAVEGTGIEAVQRALAQVRRPGYVAPLPAS